MWVAKTLKFTVEGVFRGEDKEVEGGANPCRLPAHNGEVEIPVSSRDSSCGAVLVPASQAPCSALSLNTQAVALSPAQRLWAALCTPWPASHHPPLVPPTRNDLEYILTREKNILIRTFDTRASRSFL